MQIRKSRGKGALAAALSPKPPTLLVLVVRGRSKFCLSFVL